MIFPNSIESLSKVQKRTYHLLVSHALDMFEQGKFPSISELATQAKVSRATAYRYFPTQNELITAVVDESLRPMLDWHPKHHRTEERVSELLAFAYPQMLNHEGALRAALLLSLQQWQETRSQANNTPNIVPIQRKQEKLIRGHRKQILSLAVSPLYHELSSERVETVIHALSLVYGSEVFMVLKDIWQLDDTGIQSTTQWIAKAIINQARADQAEAEAEEQEQQQEA